MGVGRGWGWRLKDRAVKFDRNGSASPAETVIGLVVIFWPSQKFGYLRQFKASCGVWVPVQLAEPHSANTCYIYP